MERYNIKDMGPDNLYKLDNDPDRKALWKARRSILDRLMTNPEKKFLIVYVLAGHGI